MTVAFCGHSNYIGNKEDEKRIIDFLEYRLKQKSCDFFLGGYGGFDNFCYTISKRYREKYKDSKLIFVTPYIDEGYLRKRSGNSFDEIIYPQIENVPPRYAITHRNRWIVEKSDIIIAYGNHNYGGAYTMYKYAQKCKKESYNIAE